MNTIRVSNNLDPDQARLLLGLIWLQTVCKSYQQMAPVGKKAGLTLSPTNLIRWFGGNMISESSLLVSVSFSLASLLLALVDLRGTLP